MGLHGALINEQFPPRNYISRALETNSFRLKGTAHLKQFSPKNQCMRISFSRLLTGIKNYFYESNFSLPFIFSRQYFSKKNYCQGWFYIT